MQTKTKGIIMISSRMPIPNMLVLEGPKELKKLLKEHDSYGKLISIYESTTGKKVPKKTKDILKSIFGLRGKESYKVNWVKVEYTDATKFEHGPFGATPTKGYTLLPEVMRVFMGRVGGNHWVTPKLKPLIINYKFSVVYDFLSILDVPKVVYDEGQGTDGHQMTNVAYFRNDVKFLTIKRVR